MDEKVWELNVGIKRYNSRGENLSLLLLQVRIGAVCLHSNLPHIQPRIYIVPMYPATYHDA